MRYSVFFIVIVTVVTACTPNQRIVNSAAGTPAPVASSTVPIGFEVDLEAMRTADFKFILVFRRKDGAVLDAEDKAWINANTPPDVNRRKLSDDGRAVIIGSNFPFMPGTIGNLTSRFVMEDHSKPEAGPIEIETPGNTNATPRSNK
jgi:hypothetical protein